MEQSNMEEEYRRIETKEAEVITPDEQAKIADMKPLDQIRYAAKKLGIVLKDPDPSCHKCHGKGYIGIKWNPVTKKHMEPIACKCIQPPMSEAAKFQYENRGFVPRNRKERRAMKRIIQKMASKTRKK